MHRITYLNLISNKTNPTIMKTNRYSTFARHSALGLKALAVSSVLILTYTILGSYDLATFGATVVELPTAMVSTPSLSTGWSYKTFRLDANTGSQPRGFMRVKTSGPTPCTISPQTSLPYHSHQLFGMYIIGIGWVLHRARLQM